MTPQGKALLNEGLTLKPYDPNAVCDAMRWQLLDYGKHGEAYVYGDIIFVEDWNGNRTKIYQQKTYPAKELDGTPCKIGHKTFTKLGELKHSAQGITGTKLFNNIPCDHKFCDHHHVLKHFFGFENAHPWIKHHEL